MKMIKSRISANPEGMKCQKWYACEIFKHLTFPQSLFRCFYCQQETFFFFIILSLCYQDYLDYYWFCERHWSLQLKRKVYIEEEKGFWLLVVYTRPTHNTLAWPLEVSWQKLWTWRACQCIMIKFQPSIKYSAYGFSIYFRTFWCLGSLSITKFSSDTVEACPA